VSGNPRYNAVGLLPVGYVDPSLSVVAQDPIFSRLSRLVIQDAGAGPRGTLPVCTCAEALVDVGVASKPVDPGAPRTPAVIGGLFTLPCNGRSRVDINHAVSARPPRCPRILLDLSSNTVAETGRQLDTRLPPSLSLLKKPTSARTWSPFVKTHGRQDLGATHSNARAIHFTRARLREVRES